MRTGDWLQTYTGVQFWPLDPREDDVHIGDIAHALSMLCRFGGHCDRFYSVAEHSILVASVVPPHLALDALMHDATEAYLVDVPRPIKRSLTNYAEIESKLWRVIARRFGLSETLDPLIHAADNAVLLAEKDQIRGAAPAPWQIGGEPALVKVFGFPPEIAKRMFLDKFRELSGAA